MPTLAPWAKYLLYAWLAIVCLACAVSDARTRRIPNKITYPTILTLIAFHTALGGLPGFYASALGLAAGMSLLIAPYALGKMGAGDVKLLGVVGAALGVSGALTAFLFTCLAGGAQGFYYLIRGYGSKDAAADGRMCYGLAIAAGAVAAMIWNLAGKEFIRF
ncbi:MAG: prepilin peptidase [Desulfovibrionaceae bacterium]|nr:prepilin peptidase [Desulfovibrionaceae bacterium]MBF0512892.1 prepilin peptidase [Desulfovibrionaceae bacterium]